MTTLLHWLTWYTIKPYSFNVTPDTWRIIETINNRYVGKFDKTLANYSGSNRR